MSKIVKSDGYNEIFKGNAGNQPTPFFVSSDASNIGNFYVANGLARRICDVVPEEMVSPGFYIDGVKDDAAFQSLWDEKKLEQKIIDALCWARLFGGSAILAIVRDGRMLKSPVGKGAQLESLRVYNRFQVTVSERETNPRNPRYGEPKLYQISPGGTVQPFFVHYTRLCICNGERMPSSDVGQSQEWGASIFNQELIDAIRDYGYCEKLATQLLRRKQQAVWKVHGLADLCDDTEGVSAARLRLAQLDDDGGVGRAIGIDASDEEYSVLNGDITGVKDFLQGKIDRIVALTGIHEIIMKNRNVGGVSASQNVALETFYKMINRKRKTDYKPILEFLLPFLITEAKWSVVFNPLSVPSGKDSAEILNRNVDSVVKLVGQQLIDNTEARATLRAICPEVKVSDEDSIQGSNPSPTFEPEPGTDPEDEAAPNQDNGGE